MPPDDIARLLRVGVATVLNVKSRYFAGGLERALHDLPRTGKPPRILPAHKAAITAFQACSAVPAGHARWTLRLLADKAVELRLVDAVSHNGAELTALAVADWAQENGVDLEFIKPGKPMPNGFIERFN